MTTPNEQRARELLLRDLRDAQAAAERVCLSEAAHLHKRAADFIEAALSHAAAVEGDAIKRLQDAIEGECDGLGVSESTARAILAHVGADAAPAAAAGGECLRCGPKPDGALDGTLTLRGLIDYGRVAANPNQGASRWHLIDLVGQMLPHLEALAAQPAAGEGQR